MTTTWCVFLKAEHSELDLLQQLRLKHDPLARRVPPHVTVVFPVALDWAPEKFVSLLERHAPAQPVPFSLGAPVRDGDYIYFPLEQGRDEATALHDTFYSTLLPAEDSTDRPYIPHVTVGRLQAGRDPALVLEEAKRFTLSAPGTLACVTLVRIAANGDVTTEYELSLAQ